MVYDPLQTVSVVLAKLAKKMEKEVICRHCFDVFLNDN